MELRLRIYEIRAGELDAWLAEWTRHVLPLRRKLGFDVLGAWIAEDDSTFTWLLGHAEDYAAADRAYYESEERRSLSPDPARHIAEARELRVRALPLD
jgi:hypothetical protein